jgi:Family of unknown function (DUF6599)
MLFLCVSGLIGCAPADEAAPDEDAAASPEESAAPAQDAASSTEELGLPPAMKADDGEGSAPKRDGDDAVAENAAEAVDTSIHDAGEYGNDALLADLMPQGWSQTGDIEHYNVATLYNKIDGRSELYMAYDVKGLSWVSMVEDANKDNFLDIFIYDMRNPTGAFGIYSVEREQDQEKLPIGRETYKTGSNYYFWKGDFYGYINASQNNEGNDAAGEGVASALMDRVADDGGVVMGLDWLPNDGLIEDSIQYFKADAMSLDFLNNTYMGEYVVDGQAKFKAFVSKRADADEAQTIYKEFNVYGGEYGDSVATDTVSGVEVGFTDWGGDFFDAVAATGNTIVGVSNVEGKEAAVKAMEKLLAALQ